MSNDSITEGLFFEKAEMDRNLTDSTVADALHGADDGELYLEYKQSESFSFDDGKLKDASFDTAQGLGLRAVADEATGFAHASDLSVAALTRAADTVKAVHSGHDGTLALAPAPMPGPPSCSTDVTPTSTATASSSGAHCSTTSPPT